MSEKCTEIVEVAEGPSVCRPDSPHLAVQQEAPYGIKAWVEGPFESILDAVRRSLDKEGFDIVTEIDVRRQFREKLGMDFPRYMILGACSADWVHRALERDRDVGLLLPCNVVVYEDSDGVIVEAVDAIAQLAIAGDGDLRALARAAKAKLQDVVDHVAAGIG